MTFWRWLRGVKPPTVDLDVAAPTPTLSLFQQRTIALLGQVDAVVIQYAESRGVAVWAKVGQC